MSMSPSSSTPAKDIFETTLELANLMKDDPAGIILELRRKGEALIGAFQDRHFGEAFQDLRQQKLHVIELAVRDISVGVITLKTSSAGVSFIDGKLIPFIRPHGTNAEGNTVFSLAWRGVDSDADPTQDEINAALYALAVLLSEVL